MMATDQIVARARFERRQDVSPEAGPGLAVVAFLLALVLGLSAIDLQQQRIPDGSLSERASPSPAIIDGRGKWGGLF
jgi:ABC-type transport system involved in cytochrome c biogenesis permease component